MMRGKSINVLTIAWTGTAAALLDGGQTAHSIFRIALPITNESICNIHVKSELAEMIKIADICDFKTTSQTIII